jgi:hypothetical protein
MTKMTKREAFAQFKAEVLPNVQKQYGTKDKAARDQAWNDYTDALCKNGDITLKQYESWTHPFN